ncbi:unnamed protein product [Sphagnum jensenii]|uniref:Uncharacterized protein n=2 Tax=Sphagnum jensenii TaxID=128206 RepID=A0ABP1BG34_9BRYO
MGREDSVSNGLITTATLACVAVLAMASVLLGWQKGRGGGRVQALIYEFQHRCALPLHLLRKISEAMTLEMTAGLTTESGSSMPMLPTFVEKMPTGNEKGVYYAVDLGGTNFRVLRVLLGGREKRVMKQEFEEVAIPHPLMVGTSVELYDFIAKKLTDFVSRESSEFSTHAAAGARELGLTFSFPISQHSINSGLLIMWTKGFKIADGVGQDVVQALQQAMNRQHGPKLRVAALVNDTVGTMAGGRYFDPDVMIGIILGTGTNACYFERADNVHKLQNGKPLPKTGSMVYNMEWGAFWSSHIPTTHVDEQLDAESINPGQQLYEKMIGGMYLGDIVRRMLLKLAREASLFSGEVPQQLMTPFVLGTPEVSKMHADESIDLRVVAKTLAKIGIHRTDLHTRRAVHDVCDIVTLRSARLAAAGITGILRKIGRDGKNGEYTRTVIAMDGGLYEHYAKFRIYIHAALTELLGEEAVKYVVVEIFKDGSGIGATLLAACHSQHG